MTTRVWKITYLNGEVYPAIVAAGFTINRDPDSKEYVTVHDPETRFIHLRAVPIGPKEALVRFNPMLFNEFLPNIPLGIFYHS